MGRSHKVGILGGTFNPIHNGHLRIAEDAQRYLHLDKVLFLPNCVSYMKHNVLDSQIRLEMVELAIEHYPCFEISDIELKRGGNSYTYETLKELTDMYPDTHFYFIMGADSLYAIEKWKKPEIICKLCTLACTVRDHVTQKELEEQVFHLKKVLKADIVILPTDYIDISSTDIRNLARQDYRAISKMVPDCVVQYIRENKIYQN